MATDTRTSSPLLRLAGAGTIALVGVGGVAILGWVRAKGLALTLEPSGFGVYGQLSTFALLAGTAGALGIGAGTTVAVASRRQAADRVGLSTVAGLSLAIPAIGGCALLAVALLLSPGLSPLLLDEDRWALIALAALSIPFVAMQLPLQHLIQGFEDVRGQTAAYLAYAAGFTAAAVIGAVIAGVTGAVIGLLLGNVLLAILYLARGRHLIRREDASFDLRAGPSAERGRFRRELLKIGSASLAVAIAYSAADLGTRSVLVHGAGQAAAGLWFALTLISVQFVASVYGAMSYLTAPLTSRFATSADRPAVRGLLDDSLRITLVMVTPLLIFVTAFREPLASFLFSSDFAELAPYIPAQMTGDLARSIAWSLGVALIPLGMTRQWLIIGIATSLFFGCFGMAAGAHWGVAGAVAAWVGAWTLTAFVTGLLLYRSGHWRPPRRIFYGVGIGALGLGLATFAPSTTAAVILPALCVVALATVLLEKDERSAIVDRVRGRNSRR